MNILKLLDFLAGLLEGTKEVVEVRAEVIYGLLFAWIHAKVVSTETILDDKGEITLKLALRDKLIKELPLEIYPLD
jgi:hypothetical protein